MNYQFEEHALQELRDAIAYYEAIDLELGQSFRDEIGRAISLIRQFPQAWPHSSASTRRCRTKRFPYGIIYRCTNDEIELLGDRTFQPRTKILG